MDRDVTGTARDDALEVYSAQVSLAEAELTAGQISREQAAEAMRAARAEYERACAANRDQP